MEKLKVMVVDDSLVYRKILTETVEGTGLGNVVCTASNGMIALERLNQQSIDVVLLDIFMPEIDGLETLKRIKKDYPFTNVIIISGGGEDSAGLTVNALEMGGMDFILKPRESDVAKSVEKLRSYLKVLFTQIKIKKYSEVTNNMVEQQKDIKQRVIMPGQSIKHEVVTEMQRPSRTALAGVDIVVIASSTGGPMALETLCAGLPADFNKPVLIVQHMPRGFTNVLAKSINKKCAIEVSEATEGEPVKKGRILLAPGGVHMVVEADRGGNSMIKFDHSPLVNGVRPAADVLFASVAKAYQRKKVLAVVLTGMGNDGMQGIRELKQACDCYCIAQSEKTCVVYGMPKSVQEAGLADEMVDLNDIARRMQQIIAGRS